MAESLFSDLTTQQNDPKRWLSNIPDGHFFALYFPQLGSWNHHLFNSQSQVSQSETWFAELLV